MRPCGACPREISGKAKICPVCHTEYHIGCALKYLCNKPPGNCCAKALNDKRYESSLVVKRRGRHSRRAEFDQRRETLDKVDKQPEKIEDLPRRSLSEGDINTLEIMGENTTEQASESRLTAPEGWATMSPEEQSASLFAGLQSIGENIMAQFNRRFDELSKTLVSTVAQHSVEIDALFSQNEKTLSEIEHLKERIVHAPPCTSLKVVGVPKTCSLELENIAAALLSALNLSKLADDVLKCRLITPRDPNPSDDQVTEPQAMGGALRKTKGGKGVKETARKDKGSGALSEGTAIDTDEKKKPYSNFSFEIMLKQTATRDLILETKRSHGVLKFSEMVPEVDEKSDSIIGLYEMLPSLTYKLYLRAKERKKTCHFKYLWIRGGVIYMQKDERTEKIPILTEDDLERIT